MSPKLASRGFRHDCKTVLFLLFSITGITLCTLDAGLAMQSKESFGLAPRHPAPRSKAQYHATCEYISMHDLASTSYIVTLGLPGAWRQWCKTNMLQLIDSVCSPSLMVVLPFPLPFEHAGVCQIRFAMTGRESESLESSEHGEGTNEAENLDCNVKAVGCYARGNRHAPKTCVSFHSSRPISWWPLTVGRKRFHQTPRFRVHEFVRAQMNFSASTQDPEKS